jgi:hypothetical protein
MMGSQGKREQPEQPPRGATFAFGTPMEKAELNRWLWVKYLVLTGRIDPGKQDR